MKKGNYVFKLRNNVNLVVGLSQKGAISWAVLRTAHRSADITKPTLLALYKFLGFIISQCGVEKDEEQTERIPDSGLEQLGQEPTLKPGEELF